MSEHIVTQRSLKFKGESPEFDVQMKIIALIWAHPLQFTAFKNIKIWVRYAHPKQGGVKSGKKQT